LPGREISHVAVMPQGLGETARCEKVLSNPAKKSTLVLLDAALCAPPTEGARSGPFFVAFLKIPEVFMSRRTVAAAGVAVPADTTLGSDDNGDATGARRVRRPVDVQRIAYTLREATAASRLSRSALYRLIGEGKLAPRKVAGRTLLLAEELHALITSAPIAPIRGAGLDGADGA
jgi:hypothetical protein